MTKSMMEISEKKIINNNSYLNSARNNELLKEKKFDHSKDIQKLSLEIFDYLIEETVTDSLYWKQFRKSSLKIKGLKETVH